MANNPETTPTGADGEATEPRRRGRGPARYPRRNPAYSPKSIIKAANAAGFASVTIDKDGRITLTKDVPSPAGDEKGEPNECDTLIKDRQGDA